MLSQNHSVATKDLDPCPRHNQFIVTTGSTVYLGPQVVAFNQCTYCSHLLLTPLYRGGGKRRLFLSITNITEQGGVITEQGGGKMSYLGVYNATLNLSFTYQLIQFIITVRDSLSRSIITDPQVCERDSLMCQQECFGDQATPKYYLITDTPRYCAC